MNPMTLISSIFESQLTNHSKLSPHFDFFDSIHDTIYIV
jgi:hypothetical protein